MRTPGKSFALDRLEIGAAALHAQHAGSRARGGRARCLHRRVAAAPHDERGLGADQAGGVDEEIETVLPCASASFQREFMAPSPYPNLPAKSPGHVDTVDAPARLLSWTRDRVDAAPCWAQR